MSDKKLSLNPADPPESQPPGSAGGTVVPPGSSNAPQTESDTDSTSTDRKMADPPDNQGGGR